jgi:type IV secretory pathway ATPase VirB11/archaellum biosynthesis ATPase
MVDQAPPVTGERVTADERGTSLRKVQSHLLDDIDEAVDKLERARIGESTREHLEILRSLLKAQVTAYLDHFVARRATLFSHTSTMYARAIGQPGVISTTLRGLIEGRTLDAAQAKTLARFIAERRTLLIFGDRATGKSTLLNALFELVSLDERFVAVERGPDLPALKERSFCVRLTVDDDTDLEALFARARRMTPSRLVMGEMHSAEVPHFVALLADDMQAGGMATLRAESAPRAVDMLVRALGGGAGARRRLTAARPVFIHMHSDEKGLPRLAAMWSVDATDDDELALEEVPTSARETSLVAEA